MYSHIMLCKNCKRRSVIPRCSGCQRLAPCCVCRVRRRRGGGSVGCGRYGAKPVGTDWRLPAACRSDAARGWAGLPLALIPQGGSPPFLLYHEAWITTTVNGKATPMSQGITQAHCNRCGHSTNHDILASDKWESPNEREDGCVPYDLHEMLKCRGCETVTLRVTSGEGTTDECPNVVYYPPAMARRVPDWAGEINLAALGLLDGPTVPLGIWSLMREVYVAVQNGSRRLAAMGIRAALESVMIDKMGDKGTFSDNMDAFQAADYLNGRQRGHLDAVLEAGHATIHRGWQPTDSQIVILLDITEAIIEGAYLHDQPADILSRSIPPRPPRPGRKS